MALNKEDINYRENRKIRIRNRFLVAVIVGIFANWLYIIILILIYSLGELVTMYKILTHSFLTNEAQDMSGREKGRAAGIAAFSAFFAFLSTLAVASIIRILKLLILHLLK
jgi:hypothetical protein